MADYKTTIKTDNVNCFKNDASEYEYIIHSVTNEMVKEICDSVNTEDLYGISFDRLNIREVMKNYDIRIGEILNKRGGWLSELTEAIRDVASEQAEDRDQEQAMDCVNFINNIISSAPDEMPKPKTKTDRLYAESRKAMKHGDLAQAVRLYNQAWELERK